MTPTFRADRDAIIDRLNAAGIVAVGDPRVQPPAVLVGAPTYRQADRTELAVETPVIVLEAPPGDAEALAAALDTVAAIYAALGPYGLEAVPSTYPLGGDRECPCYVITLAATADIC